MNTAMRALFLLVIFSVPFGVHAATLYMSPSKTEMHSGDTIAVAVRIDTDEDECINVIDGVITYSANISPVDISRGESILPIWVEEPVINKEKKTVSFAGGIPNGYCGRIEGDPGLTNIVLELVFQAPGLVVGSSGDESEASIRFADGTRVLLNDGFGSEARLKTFGSDVTLHRQPGPTVINEWRDRIEEDTIPPGEFSISLERDPSAFRGQYFIVFNTTDKQSGIDHYQVMEEPLDVLNRFKFGAANAPWTQARSPYLLEDQSLNSTIRVKAVDKAGNEYIATLVPDESLRQQQSNSSLWYILTGSGLLVLILLGAYFVYRRYSKQVRNKEQFDAVTTDDSV